MHYRNPARRQTRPEEATHREWHELSRLLLIVAAIFLAIVFVFDRMSYWLAPKIPFSWETKIAQTLELEKQLPKTLGGKLKKEKPEQIKAIQSALQARADRITQALNVPADIPITIRYVPSSTVNAAATLGGTIVVFRGLLEQLDYEEELDAILAHEIGHVTERHMVRHLSRALTTSVALHALGIRSSSLTRWMIGDAEQLQQLSYSRDAEREADAVAHRAAYSLHGHTKGISRLFERFEKLQQEATGHQAVAALEFLQSHPLPENRKKTAQNLSPGSLPELTPLTPPLRLKPADTPG